MNPRPSNVAYPVNAAHLWASRCDSTGSTPWETTSQKRKTRIPVAIDESAARILSDTLLSAPIGRPTKIVKPAMAPRRRVCVVLM